MKYFKLEKEEIVKYEIIIDKEITKIKTEIIENCSIMFHKEYETSNPLRDYNPLIYRNYKEEKLNNSLYAISYDYYSFDPLVRIIDELLHNNVTDLDYLYNPSNLDNQELKTLLSQKEDILKHIRYLDSPNINNISTLLLTYQNHLKEIDNSIALFKLREEKHALAISYIPKILELITFKEIARYNLKTINSLTAFLEYPEVNVTTLNLTKKKD